MNQLLRNNIDWDALGCTGTDKIRCEIEDAFIDRESGELHVRLGLNFVMRTEDETRVAEAIQREISGVDRVRYLDCATHYFQSALAAELAELLLETVLQNDDRRAWEEVPS